MYWTEDADKNEVFQVPENILDLSFRIDCKCLPNDHAWPLSQALQQALPWLSQEQGAGIHLIHGPGSQNGWMRPEGPDELIHLSKRTRLTLRMPSERVDDALALEGEQLEFNEYRVVLGMAHVKPLSTYEVQFSRNVICDPGMEEEHFLEHAADEIRKLDIRPRKLMSGMTQQLRSPDGDVTTRSLMVADLEPQEAVALQEIGIGGGRLLGCGLFTPHKGIKSARES
ncbi:MAG TPA: type I-MYXAN CRISPR-associated protein Cas6/Cmx6 [Gammaproteobacteria bacterium]|nr:type I-MYXAN CRISPR-associated protein Cas6/Cmx6 [Gammaproteobacteria bacterium]